MAEQNQPIDVTKDKIYSVRENIEEPLTRLPYNNKKYDLIDLIRKINENEPRIMSSMETDTYVAFREGLQIFKTLSDMLADKTGLRQNLAGTAKPPMPETEVTKLKDFCYNYAAFVASSYVVKKLDSILLADVNNQIKQERKEDLGTLVLDTTRSQENVMGQLFGPVLERVTKHVEGGRQYFKTPYDFTLFVRNVFDKFAEATKARKDNYPTLSKHINGYRWRVMDDYLSLENWADMSIPVAKASDQKTSFRPIRSEEIVGNKSAKRKIARYVDRLMLYDLAAKKNPIIDMGGLAWTVLFDGPPGTGKSSLFRLAMTLLDERAKQLGIKYNIFTVDQSIKDEYYGKTGKILLEKLGVTKDQSALSLGIFDDLDLLTTPRREAQGADNDINNIVMQYLDGVYTLRLGNVINFAATNKPTGLDDALRNRFNDRFLIDGPVTAEDFADMVNLELKPLIKIKKLEMDNGKGYNPFATQDIRRDDGSWTATEDVSAYMADEFKKFKKSSVIDFGRFMADLKAKNPKITGRSSKAIMESIKTRSADFDIPNGWFTDKKQFFDLPFEKKLQAVGKLYVPITPDILFQEAQRYFDSEQRYANSEAVEQIGRGYDNRVWNMLAEMKVLEENIKKAKDGNISDIEKLQALRTQMGVLEEASNKAVMDALEKASKPGK